ncbi:MAG: M20/M25/M40 family metallo-hydrolase [Firmicutes bacterium]|nr:M20/M25/M40 family metallo-hydrolase [Bacillota bacterium]
MNQQDLAWMKRLSEAFGPSGFEDEVAAVARAYAEPFADVEEDNIRNLYIRRRQNTGGKPVVLLDAHSDEVGFMVQFIQPNGTLQFVQLGSWNESSVPGTRVWVLNDRGEKIPGIVAAKPVHFMKSGEKDVALHTSDMVIDVGAVSDTDVRETFGIRVGAPVTPAVDFAADEARGIMIGKAFDCRVGCMALLMAMKELAGMDLAVDVVGVLSTQEEVGGRGAPVAARTVDPAVTIDFEGCPADDTFTPAYAVQSAIKKGLMIRLFDVGMITHPRFARFTLDLCEQSGIPVQVAVRSGGGTNGGIYHKMQKGIPSVVVSVVSRYAHTPQGFAAMQDVDLAAQAAVEMVRALTPDVIRQF